MTRPVSVDQLLAGDEEKKPKFLGKKRRLVESTEHIGSQTFKRSTTSRAGKYEDIQVNDVGSDSNDLRALAAKSAKMLREKNDREGKGRDAVGITDDYLGKHWSDKKYDEMTTRDWRIFCEDFSISTKGGTAEKPLRNWHELNLIPPDLLDIITNKLHYKEPTPIQRSTIPNVRNNRDFVGVASTGSGKTLSFLLPIFIKLSNRPPLNSITKLDGPVALILAPTRELAQQIQREGSMITKLWKRPCNIISIVGGHSLEEISASLRDGCDILVATPGRLIDCLESHIVLLKQLELLVLDEADKMIDFGFEDQLTTILARTEALPNRQTMMFTATFSPAIEKVANGYLKKSIYVTIGGEESKPNIKQIIEYVPDDDDQKFNMLTNVFLPKYKSPIIIFINYKTTADWLFEKFKGTKFRVSTLHGSKSQEQREHSLKLLRNGKVDILIATDVAGRGIDIPNVSLVVNFQFPKKFDSFVHRVGRTGRAGKSGAALTFLGDSEDEGLMTSLFDYVKKNDVSGENYISKAARTRYSVERNAYKPIII